jgi:hypothetical protein
MARATIHRFTREGKKMSSEKLIRVYSLVASMEALKVEAEAMKVDNVERALKGQAPAWRGENFVILSDELHSVAAELKGMVKGNES